MDSNGEWTPFFNSLCTFLVFPTTEVVPGAYVGKKPEISLNYKEINYEGKLIY